MRKLLGISLLLLATTAWAADPAFQVQIRYIEACSCDLFCPCYFQDHASHQGSGEHKCTFNNVGKVTAGKYGDVELTGLKYWLSGDLGADWGTKHEADWVVATFEPSATQAQKDAMMAVIGKIYPVKWKSVEFDTTGITWKVSADGKTAEAHMANGKGDVKMTRAEGQDGIKGAQVNNVKYFAATWNSPFNLYYSDHFYKGKGPNQNYALHHANGFMITVEATSDGQRVKIDKPAATKKTE